MAVSLSVIDMRYDLNPYQKISISDKMFFISSEGFHCTVTMLEVGKKNF